MRGIGRGAVALALGSLIGCGTAEAPTPDFYVRGTGIVVNSSAPFTQRPDLPQRIESTIGAALRYWEGNWLVLQGRTVTLEGDRHVTCPGSADAIGCYDGNIRVSTRDVTFAYYCVEETALVHEVGHAVIGDPAHLDPRWMDFASLTQELAGRTGYGPDGEAPCQIWTSVWQHPPER